MNELIAIRLLSVYEPKRRDERQLTRIPPQYPSLPSKTLACNKGIIQQIIHEARSTLNRYTILASLRHRPRIRRKRVILLKTNVSIVKLVFGGFGGFGLIIVCWTVSHLRIVKSPQLI